MTPPKHVTHYGPRSGYLHYYMIPHHATPTQVKNRADFHISATRGRFIVFEKKEKNRHIQSVNRYLWHNEEYDFDDGDWQKYPFHNN
jgi:hypothetical protein